MGFLITTLIFALIGIIASLCTRICCNRGPSANLLNWNESYHLSLDWVPPNTGHYSNSLLLDDVILIRAWT
ncbi:hypothetical protein CRYUN_Cryun11dG0014500 [Craigia yunnanensis]